MARKKTATAAAGAAARWSRLRGGDPLYIHDAPETIAGHARRGFRSSTPLMAHVLDAEPDLSGLERAHHSAVRRRARRRRVRRFHRLHPKTVAAVPRGALSVALYALLFTNERQVLDMSVNYWWSFLVPVSIALVFSLVHGSFTAAFWDALGLRPNTIRK